MANRMLKESLKTSKKINSLTDFQFRLWIHLILSADDYGRGYADPELVKSLSFPRRRVTEQSIKDALTVLSEQGCIHLYENDGESYYCFVNWGEHQRIQTKVSKYPGPDDTGSIIDDSRKPTVTHGEILLETKTELETKTNISSDTDLFEEFWKAYPAVRHEAKSKARQAWNKLKPDRQLTDSILSALNWQKQTEKWHEDGGRFIPMPATYLNQRRWEDEKPALTVIDKQTGQKSSNIFLDILRDEGGSNA